MKSILLPFLLLSVFLISCRSNPKSSAKTSVSPQEKESKMPDENAFTLLHSSSKKWTAGIPSGGTGTEYRFKLKVNTTDKLEFDSAWVNNNALKAFVVQEYGAISNKTMDYTKGDTITVGVSDLKKPGTPIQQVAPPIDYNGAVLLGYKLNSKRMYFTVSEIKEKIIENRP